jgi:hypothetical protein
MHITLTVPYIPVLLTTQVHEDRIGGDLVMKFFRLLEDQMEQPTVYIIGLSKFWKP